MLSRDQSKIADCFLDYFSSVANSIGDIKLLESNEEQLKSHTSGQRINEYKKVVNGPQFQFERLHCEEITKALKELNVRKGMGHDRVPNSILRLGSEELAPSLTTIYNNCIDACYWPSECKKGEWTPVYKKDSIYEVKNYRPVTLLPACDKVLEKLLSQHVTAFIEPRLSRNLTAYRKRHSTETSLIKLTENWKRAINDRNIVGILSTDMSKAFDSLHPPLHAYGFSASSTGLIQSYLTERKYREKIGTEITSEWKEVLRGCPQGSTFGPFGPFETRFKMILTSLQMNTT